MTRKKKTPEEVRTARSNAGKARQAKLLPVKELAFQLANLYCEETGEQDPKKVARAIVSRLGDFVRTHRISMVVGEHFERTIQLWLKKSWQPGLKPSRLA